MPGTSQPMTKLQDASVVLLAIFTLATGLATADIFTWTLEVSWVFLAMLLYAFAFRKKSMTTLLFSLLMTHCVILVIGGYYTYEKVPAGLCLKDILGLERNNYDRLGHFMQGFVPAILIREILLRSKTASRTTLLPPTVFMMCMGFSSCFELLEWAVSVSFHDRADAFLGMQGDPWDAQWDMFCCLLGSTSSLILLSRLHDRQLASIHPSGQGGHPPVKDETQAIHKVRLPDKRTLDCRFRRSDKCRRLSLRFARDGLLEAVLPRRSSEEDAHAFIRKSLPWIARNLAKLETRKAATPQEPPLPERLHLEACDTSYAVKYINTPKLGFVSVRLDSQETLIVQGDISCIPPCQDAIKAWLKMRAKPVFASAIQLMSNQTGMTCSGFSVRDQRSRWGSCSKAKRISLNFRLLLMPPDILRYVILHELCHTVEMNHSPHFWRLLKEHIPHYAPLRKSLHEKAASLPSWLSSVQEF